MIDELPALLAAYFPPCPVEGETTREMFKRIVKEIGRAHPQAGINALRSLENIKEEYLPGSVISEDICI